MNRGDDNLVWLCVSVCCIFIIPRHAGQHVDSTRPSVQPRSMSTRALQERRCRIASITRAPRLPGETVIDRQHAMADIAVSQGILVTRFQRTMASALANIMSNRSISLARFFLCRTHSFFSVEIVFFFSGVLYPEELLHESTAVCTAMNDGCPIYVWLLSACFCRLCVAAVCLPDPFVRWMLIRCCRAFTAMGLLHDALGNEVSCCC